MTNIINERIRERKIKTIMANIERVEAMLVEARAERKQAQEYGSTQLIQKFDEHIAETENILEELKNEMKAYSGE